MTLPLLPKPTMDCTGAWVYNEPALLEWQRETVEACAKLCDEGHDLQNSSFQGVATKIIGLLI